MLLVHIGQPAVAEAVHNAWLRTIEDGIHTYDIHTAGVSSQRVGTRAFAEAVIARLGQRPERLAAVAYGDTPILSLSPAVARTAQTARKDLVGVDVFVHWRGPGPETLAAALAPLATTELPLTMITNRGVKVWPDGVSETICTDHWRCRFEARQPISHAAIVALLDRCARVGLDFIKTEHLYNFDGEPGYSLGQGQ